MKHSLHHSLSLSLSLERRGFLGTLGALAATSLPVRSMAQATPSAAAAATTIIVPFPPGGISDATVRLVGGKLAGVLDTKVVVDNRPGGNGLIGVQAMKGAPADGSRLFIGNTGTHSANPYFYAKLPYDPAQDFVPVSGLVATPHVLVVRTESPVKSLAQLIELAKSKPGGLSFASQGAGSGGHLLGAMLAKRTGIAMTHVPYRGAPPALIDLLGGQVDLLFDSVPTSLPFIRDGKLRVLASASPKRNPLFPDVPSTAELGYPEIEMSFWFGVFAPAGTPEATVAKLNTAFVSVIETPEVRTKLTEQGLEIIAGPRDKFREFMAADNRNLGRLIKTTGATIE